MTENPPMTQQVDWPLIIYRLRGARMTIREIAHHCGVHHSTIVRLQAGDFHEPKHALGQCLLKLIAETHRKDVV